MWMIREHLEVSGTKAVFAVDVVAGEGRIPVPGQAVLCLSALACSGRSESPRGTAAPPCSDSRAGSGIRRRGAVPEPSPHPGGSSPGATGHLPLTHPGRGATAL